MKTTYNNYTNDALPRATDNPATIRAVVFTEDGQCHLKSEMWTSGSQASVNIDVTADELRNIASVLLRTADEIDAIKAGLQEVAA